MRRLRFRFVLPVLAIGVAVSSVWAAEHICEDAICPAYKVVGGVAKMTLFARGDVVDTEEGWVVYHAHGWDEL